MKTMYDVQQLFKRFGIFIYVGNRLWDIELMMIELKKLEEAGLIDKQLFMKAMLVLKHEHRLEEEYQEGK